MEEAAEPLSDYSKTNLGENPSRENMYEPPTFHQGVLLLSLKRPNVMNSNQLPNVLKNSLTVLERDGDENHPTTIQSSVVTAKGH